MSDRIETVILRNLFFNEEYTRKVIPHLKSEYFRQSHEKAIFDAINNFVNEYNSCPSVEAINIALEKSTNLHEDTYKEVSQTLGIIESDKDKKLKQEWLIDHTEDFCKDKAITNAVYKAVAILEGTEKKLEKGAIPDIFNQALGVSFDTSVGHNYVENAENRYDLLHSSTYKLPFDLDILNTVTKGGVTGGTLNIIGAGVYVGKTLGLCHFASSYLKQGKNVLYITLEISEANIGFRIDCNLLNISTDEFDNIPKDVYLKRIEKIKSSPSTGRLIVKEYPAQSVHVNNFRALIHELAVKLEFVPDVILIDYLNLCASSKIKSSDKTHITIQSVSEELHGLAKELDVPIWSATQLDAEGMTSSDPGMTNIAQSKVGLIATCDLLWMLVSNEKLRELGQLLVIQQKNRYKDIEMKKFFIGIDRKKMRWYNTEQKAQASVQDDVEDPLDEDLSDMKSRVSKKYGSHVYEPAYKTKQTKQFGPRNTKKFEGFTV